MKPKSQDKALAERTLSTFDDPALVARVVERMLQLSAEHSELKRRLSEADSEIIDDLERAAVAGD